MLTSGCPRTSRPRWWIFVGQAAAPARSRLPVAKLLIEVGVLGRHLGFGDQIDVRLGQFLGAEGAPIALFIGNAFEPTLMNFRVSAISRVLRNARRLA